MVNRTLSFEPRGGLTEVLLRAFKQGLGVGLKGAFTGDFEIKANVGDYRFLIVQALVNTSEKKVYIAIGLGGVEADSVEGAALGLGDLAESELYESETIFANGGGGCEDKTSLSERVSL